MKGLGRTLGFALAGAMAVGLTAVPAVSQTAAGNYKIIKRIGGRTSSICAPLRGTRSLVGMAEDARIQQDLRAVLAEAGLSSLSDDSLAGAPDQQPLGRS